MDQNDRETRETINKYIFHFHMTYRQYKGARFESLPKMNEKYEIMPMNSYNQNEIQKTILQVNILCSGSLVLDNYKGIVLSDFVLYFV